MATVRIRRIAGSISGLVLGLIYGLLLRLAYEAPLNGIQGDLLSFTFLVFAPFSIGAIAVFFTREEKRTSGTQQAFIGFKCMALAILASFITALEGAICVIIAAPILLSVAPLGALFAGYLLRWRKAKTATISCIGVLPFVMMPIETQFPNETYLYTIENSIFIAAPAEQVWSNITSVREIAEDELSWSFIHSIGVPKPRRAEMQNYGPNGLRTSYWHDGIRFQEEISEWSENEEMAWNFRFDDSSFPQGQLDEHVQVGGDYFDIIKGGYRLQAVEGGTNLVLWTTYEDKSDLAFYSRWWGNFIFDDFHAVILQLIKSRTETRTKIASQ